MESYMESSIKPAATSIDDLALVKGNSKFCSLYQLEKWSIFSVLDVKLVQSMSKT